MNVVSKLCKQPLAQGFIIVLLLLGGWSVVGVGHAAAAAPSKCTSQHEIGVNVYSYNAATGAQIGGAHVTESRGGVAVCPNGPNGNDGTYIDDSGQSGHAPNSATTAVGGINLNDSCWNSSPYLTQSPPSGGYTFSKAVIQAYGSSGNGPPPTTLDSNHGTQADFAAAMAKYWTPSLQNMGAGFIIQLYYDVPTTWQLTGGDSGPATTTPGVAAQLTHHVDNLGPSSATYKWHVQGVYQPSGGGAPSAGSSKWSGSGLPSGSGSAGPGASDPDNSVTSPAANNYIFPSGASDGATYCERITYTNATGPSTGTGNTSGTCVKLVTGPGPGGGCTTQCGTPSVTSTCTTVDASDPDTGIYQTPQTSVPGGWSTTQQGTAVPTKTVVTVTDSSGATLLSGGQVGFGYDSSGHWGYTPQGATVTISVANQEYALQHDRDSHGNEIYDWVTYSTAGSTSYSCYSATCNVSVVPSKLPDGTSLPAGGVLAGQSFSLSGSITSTGALDLPASVAGAGLSLTAASPSGPNYTGGGISGGPVGVSLADQNPVSGSYTITYYPDYWGDAGMLGFGTACTATVDVYQAFTLKPTSQATLSPSTEDPNEVLNSVYVTESGAPVSENVTSTLSETPVGGSAINKGSASAGGPFSPGVTCLFQSMTPTQAPISGCSSALDNGEYAPRTPVQAGDQYCAVLNVPDTAGYVDSAGNIADGTAGTPDTSCENIDNKPFFKVYGSSVSAGGGFQASDPACTGGGTLAGWNNNTGTNPSGDFGSSAQFTAAALSDITGFASAQTALGRSPTGLTFANSGTGVNITSDSYSPALGGDMGGSRCLTDVSVAVGQSTVSGTPTPYNYSGNSSLSGNQSVFVKGNAYISGNVVYAGSGGGWTLTSVPSFVLHATGNIYINPNVTELDGMYVAEGKIYTCANSAGSGPMATAALYAGCNQQLTVHGSLVATQVDMMRTFGSLRDDAPIITAGIPGSADTYADQSVAFSRYDCPGAPGSIGIHFYQNTGNSQPAEPGGCNLESTMGYILPATPAGGCYESDAVPLWYAQGPQPGPYATGDNFYTINPGSEPATKVIGCVPSSSISGVTTPVYRFSDNANFYHFYTTSCSEGSFQVSCHSTPGSPGSDHIQYDGVAFYVYDNPNQGGVVTHHPGTVTQAHAPTPSDLQALNNHSGCSNNGGGWLSKQTCAAEVFQFSPEMYLSTPNVAPPSGGATQYDAITGLPPIL